MTTAPHDIPDEFAYEHIYEILRDALVSLQNPSTRQITARIKQLFCDEYGQKHQVLCSGGNHTEYMVDLLVTSFAPKHLLGNKPLVLKPSQFEIYLAVESELGGVSASSAFGVMKNAAEDFLKLLLVSCSRRVMIMTSLVASKETKHVEARVEILRQMYAHFPHLNSGGLIVHLNGTQPKSSQVQAMTHPEAIRGFVISASGDEAIELKPLS